MEGGGGRKKEVQVLPPSRREEGRAVRPGLLACVWWLPGDLASSAHNAEITVPWLWMEREAGTELGGCFDSRTTQFWVVGVRFAPQ